MIEEAAGLAAEGLDLGLDLGTVYMAQPHDPVVFQPLAEAIPGFGRVGSIDFSASKPRAAAWAGAYTPNSTSSAAVIRRSRLAGNSWLFIG